MTALARRERIRLVTLIAVLAMTVVGLGATGLDAAAADVYCVAPQPGWSCDLPFTGLQPALDKAASHVGTDTIFIGDGTFSDGPFCYAANDALHIVGQGPIQTTLTMDRPSSPCPPAFPRIPGLPDFPPSVLTLSNGGFTAPAPNGEFPPHIEVSNLGILIPAFADLSGMVLEGAFVSHARVAADLGAVHPTGVVTQGIDASFASGSIELPFEASVGLRAEAVATGVALSRISAVTGVLSSGLNVLDQLYTGDVSIDSSLVQIAPAQPSTGPPGIGLLTMGVPGAPPEIRTLTARNTTVFGSGRPDETGVEVRTSPGSVGSAQVSNSIIDNLATSLRRRANGGVAMLSTDYSYYSSATDDDQTGTGGPIIVQHRAQGPPGFIDAARGDFQLGPGSSLIDAGDPRGLGPFEPSFDLGGHPRILDGKLDPNLPGCDARRDVGAFEFLSPNLLVRVSAPRDGIAGRPVELDASDSCDPDPGASLAYRWTFDDGGAAGGGRVLHTFVDPGSHSATVEVTSSGGRSGQAHISIIVSLPPGTPAAVGPNATPEPPPPNKAPHLRRLDVRPFAFKAAFAGATATRSTGASVRYRLSEPAAIRFTVERRVRRGHGRGRFVQLRGAFTQRGRKDSNKFRFSGRLAGRRLRAGVYRLVGVPTDAVGAHGNTARARFRIAS